MITVTLNKSWTKQQIFTHGCLKNVLPEMPSTCVTSVLQWPYINNYLVKFSLMICNQARIKGKQP